MGKGQEEQIEVARGGSVWERGWLAGCPGGDDRDRRVARADREQV